MAGFRDDHPNARWTATAITDESNPEEIWDASLFVLVTTLVNAHSL